MNQVNRRRHLIHVSILQRDVCLSAGDPVPALESLQSYANITLIRFSALFAFTLLEEVS